VIWPWTKSAAKTADGFTAPTVRAVLQMVGGVNQRLLYVAGVELNCLETENAALREKVSVLGVQRLEAETMALRARVMDLEEQLRVLDGEP